MLDVEPMPRLEPGSPVPRSTALVVTPHPLPIHYRVHNKLQGSGCNKATPLHYEKQLAPQTHEAWSGQGKEGTCIVRMRGFWAFYISVIMGGLL